MSDSSSLSWSLEVMEAAKAAPTQRHNFIHPKPLSRKARVRLFLRRTWRAIAWWIA